MIGAGKYDDACTVARLATKSEGVILIVYGGEHGDRRENARSVASSGRPDRSQ